MHDERDAVPEAVRDSPTGWVSVHIRRYLETDGAEGHDYQGFPTLLITTRGRRTGALRRTALIYGRDGDRHVVVASNGAAARDPSWFLNLRADPVVRVQVRADRFVARARVADPVERPRLWELMAGIFPMYRTYAEQAPRQIPVVLLERR
ncbi:nitroreductase family deazaflavin-dependent oxidoreductase [Plantactinospora sp. KLBMP9567]|uniref:nitroreductase family deazaflavin-dependent oxidoreductase n=1 Tax=Plantactinospora sp. KLBMP9567 TaxID=3085900 RepID=UPI0029825B07|nr:nitroreductase family deazaflavin-dependent oxidoreductase [Plantactinospora sp. KLBMP9567]MDW5322619.1 nitroreductase family deazaflavin-dependent oxidoreductase [Plantactinospora sp. KLBMP9567]